MSEGIVGPDKETDMPAKRRRTLKARVDDKLDQALKDSFPASDPVAFIEPAPVKQGDRTLPTVEATGQVPTSRAGGRAKGKATRR
jgi:hypothetical protein